MPENGEGQEFARREGDAPVVKSQRRYSRVAFWAGTVVLLVTVLFPVLESLLNVSIQVTGWGCTTVAVGDCETVCQKLSLKSPFPLLVGISTGLGLYLASAAFAQTAVGATGKTFLGKLVEKMPFGGAS